MICLIMYSKFLSIVTEDLMLQIKVASSSSLRREVFYCTTDTNHIIDITCVCGCGLKINYLDISFLESAMSTNEERVIKKKLART